MIEVYHFHPGGPFAASTFHTCGRELVVGEINQAGQPEIIVMCWGCMSIWRTGIRASFGGYAGGLRASPVDRVGDFKIIYAASALSRGAAATDARRHSRKSPRGKPRRGNEQENSR